MADNIGAAMHRLVTTFVFLVYWQLAMKKHRDCTVPVQNWSQFVLTFDEGQQINTHFRFIGNANVHMRFAIPVPY